LLANAGQVPWFYLTRPSHVNSAWHSLRCFYTFSSCTSFHVANCIRSCFRVNKVEEKVQFAAIDMLSFVHGLAPRHLHRTPLGGNRCERRARWQQVVPARAPRPARTPTRCTATWRTVDIDAERDKNLFDLEAKLVEAVEAEAFSEASVLRDEIARLQSPAFVEVLQAHMRFYRAFDTVSLRACGSPEFFTLPTNSVLKPRFSCRLQRSLTRPCIILVF
jgi:hypothetical protein